MRSVLALTALALAFAAAPAAALAPPGAMVCVPIYDFPDNGLAYCVDPDGPCLLIEHRTTFAGPIERCLVDHPL